MSTASVVPETWELTGDDAWRTLRHTNRRDLLVDAFMRMRVADGFSHARSMAFLTGLVLVQGTIAVVGFASAMGQSGVATAISNTIQNAVPGPAGQVLTIAIAQAEHAGDSRRYLALAIGLVGTLISLTTAMGQLERGMNRIYGVEQDRPMPKKYGLAFLLALTAGTLSCIAFVLVAFGQSVGDSLHNEMVNDAWGFVRWPTALALMIAAMALLFRWSPRRHQPGWSWLAFGAAVSVVLWFVVTAALGVFFRLSSSFGDTYGPLAGIVALQLWALGSGMVIFYGAAVGAQLEAARAGIAEPQDETKVADSEPELAGADDETVDGEDADGRPVTAGVGA